MRIFGPAGVAAAASGFPVETVAAGDEVEVGPFRLRFFGGRHAQIHPSIPIIDNLGVLVNDALYYGGDSFVVPEGVAVDVLAAPANAPWMKIGEVMDYVIAVAPRRAFPTHEMLLSRAGKDLSNARLALGRRAGRRRVPAARAGRRDRLLTAGRSADARRVADQPGPPAAVAVAVRRCRSRCRCRCPLPPPSGAVAPAGGSSRSGRRRRRGRAGARRHRPEPAPR